MATFLAICFYDSSAVKNKESGLNIFLFSYFYFIFDLFYFILFLELGLGLE